MYITYADGTMLTCGFSGEMPQEYHNSYAKMDNIFAELTAFLPEYVPQPMVMGEVEYGADADALCADFAANVDWQKWVCVMPSNALVAVKDNLVLCLVADGGLYARTAAGIENAGWTVAETMENPAV